MNTPQLSIVIPAFNEAAHLAEVITALAHSLEQAKIDHEIYVVNNGSSDGTSDVIRGLHAKNPRILGIELAQNQQYGGGILAGLAAARGEVLGWAHADGQTDPGDIIRLYQRMRAEDRELGKAVRVLSFEPRIRKMLSAAYYAIFQILFWIPYRDMYGTPKLLTRNALEKFSLESRDWFIDPEFVIKALRHKMPILEIETTWHVRKSGGTKARLFLAGLEFFKNMLLYRFRLK